jgi:phospholipid/cholesterol/gamma-HCH transport system substrate-binding protein
MRIASTFIGRMAILSVFLLVSLAMFLYMDLQTGAHIPLLSSKPKELAFYTQNLDNLVTASQAQVAGVRVGQVLDSEATDKGGKVTFEVYQDHWPLHQGLKIRIGQRSLVGESYLELLDGHGPPIPEGTTLPNDSILPVVNLYDVYDTLDAKTRATTSQMLQSLGQSTSQTKDQLSATMDGLSSLGRSGHDAIDAIAAQDTDLRKLAAQTTTFLQALDTGEGQIANLVGSANRVTQATASQKASFDETVRLLPETLDNVRDASGSLHDLAGNLSPVARDLRHADRKLSDALIQLPDLSRNLRGLMPPAHGVLRRAPKTLDRVSPFADDVSDTIGPARTVLADVNPVVGYLRPYGPDLAAFFANFSAAAGEHDSAGRYNIRALAMINEKALVTPVGTPLSAAIYSNPFPKPGAGARPGPWNGKYPRVEREPR